MGMQWTLILNLIGIWNKFWGIQIGQLPAFVSPDVILVGTCFLMKTGAIEQIKRSP